MRLLLEVSHKDTRKTNRLEVTNISYFLYRCAIAFQWNLKLIPLHWHHFIVAQLHIRLHDAGDMLLTNAHHILLAQRDMITIEAFAIVERIVVIYILYVGI